jgi:hypothetical protein
MPKKIICHKFTQKKMFYDHNILHMWQGHFVSIFLYEKIISLLFYLGDSISKHVMYTKL